MEAAYVGNRGTWWTAPLLSTMNYDGISPQTLQSKFGINIQNPADQQLLLTPINSPIVIARFPNLANPNNVYPGFPGSEPLIAALVPEPQWYGGVPPFLGPPDGDTWYDSLQVKFTKRYSHGLTAQDRVHLSEGTDQRRQFEYFLSDAQRSAHQRHIQSRDRQADLRLRYSPRVDH